MNQGFRLRFDQMREGNPASSSGDTEPDKPVDELSGQSRNLGIAWPDGRRMFFCYAYLVACEFEPGVDANAITLIFTSYVISLRGYHLVNLFLALQDHVPRTIEATDARYALADDNTDSVVIEIGVSKSGS